MHHSRTARRREHLGDRPCRGPRWHPRDRAVVFQAFRRDATEPRPSPNAAAPSLSDMGAEALPPKRSLNRPDARIPKCEEVFYRGRNRCCHIRRRKPMSEPGLRVERFPIGEDGLGDEFGVDHAAGLLRMKVVGSEQVAPAFCWCVPVNQHGVVVALNSGCQFAVGG